MGMFSGMVPNSLMRLTPTLQKIQSLPEDDIDFNAAANHIT